MVESRHADDLLASLWRSPVVSRLMVVILRAKQASRCRPRLADSTLAVAIALLGARALFTPGISDAGRMFGHVPIAVAVVALAGQAIPLAWLRSAPSVVAVVVLGANLAQWLAGFSSPSTLGMLLALYSVARRESFRRLCQVATATAAALVIPAFTFTPFNQQAWTSLFLLSCAVTAASALGVVARVRQDRIEALKERAERLEIEREQRAQLATLAERARVSREMHDIVGHHLAVIIGLADSAGFAADLKRSGEMLRLIGDTGRQALVELRRTLGAMRAHPIGREASSAQLLDLSPQPGLADIGGLCERLRAAGPAVEYRLQGQTEPAPAGVQLAAYRIVQEALTNSLKHAGAATKVRVTVSGIEGDLLLEVRDTGPGAPARGQARPDAARPAGLDGLGLGGIAERATLTGGTAQAGPLPCGEGWLVRARLPLTAGSEDEEAAR